MNVPEPWLLQQYLQETGITDIYKMAGVTGGHRHMCVWKLLQARACAVHSFLRESSNP